MSTSNSNSNSNSNNISSSDSSSSSSAYVISKATNAHQEAAVQVREKISPLKTRAGVVHASVTPPKFPSEIEQQVVGKSPQRIKTAVSPSSTLNRTYHSKTEGKSPRSQIFEKNLRIASKSMFDDDMDSTPSAMDAENTPFPKSDRSTSTDIDTLTFTAQDSSDDMSASSRGHQAEPIRWSVDSPLQPLPPLTPVKNVGSSPGNIAVNLFSDAVSASTSNTNTFKAVHLRRKSEKEEQTGSITTKSRNITAPQVRGKSFKISPPDLQQQDQLAERSSMITSSPSPISTPSSSRSAEFNSCSKPSPSSASASPERPSRGNDLPVFKRRTFLDICTGHSELCGYAAYLIENDKALGLTLDQTDAKIVLNFTSMSKEELDAKLDVLVANSENYIHIFNIQKLSTVQLAIVSMLHCIRSSISKLSLRRAHVIGRQLSTNGLFGRKFLMKPQDFLTQSKEALSRCNAIRDRLKSMNVLVEPSAVLRLLDDVSNEVCAVIDAAELCRNTHSDKSFRDAADEAFNILAKYIQEINMDANVYSILKSLTDNETVFQACSEEERLFVVDMKLEFERGGVHLTGSTRERSVTLHDEVSQYQSMYMQNLLDIEAFEITTLTPEHEAQLKPWLENYVEQPSKSVLCPSSRRVVHSLLRLMPNEQTRKEIFQKSRKYPSKNREALGALIRSRYLLATTLGFESFASKYLSNKVLSTPSEVQNLLSHAADCVRPKLSQEMSKLLDLKRQVQHNKEASMPFISTTCTTKLRPWDITYLLNLSQSVTSPTDSASSVSVMSEYFPLKDCLQSIVDISKQLFGISFKPQKLSSEESWVIDNEGGILSTLLGKRNDDVLKYNCIDESGELLGTVYLDLFQRPQKFGNAAHFTVQCGCPGPDGQYQLPIVALIFSIIGTSRGIDGSKLNTLISFSELETLYHEWGHALHSILSRTKFQHLSGPRGSTDFVEVPSELFEYFARSPKVLTQWARHNETKSGIREELINDALALRKTYSGFDAMTQILYAAVDQYIHSEEIKHLTSNQPETVYTALERGVTDLQQRLVGTDIVYTDLLSHGHITDYGGGYYSYLFAKMYAAQIWKNRFEGDPLNRIQGRYLRDEVLKHGSSRDPKLLLNKLAGGNLDPKFYLCELIV